VLCCAVARQKNQYEAKWFVPLVDLSLEDRLQSPGLPLTKVSFLFMHIHSSLRHMQQL